MKGVNIPYSNSAFRMMAIFYRYFFENKDTDWEKILSPSLMTILKPTWVNRKKDPYWLLDNEIVLHMYWLIMAHHTLKSDIENLEKIIENKVEGGD